MVIVTYFRRLALALALCASPAAAAPGFEDLDALQSRLVAALGADVGQPGGPAGPIDRRLKLAACPTGVMVEAPALGAATLRCDALGWRIRVPLVRTLAAASAGPQAQAEPAVRKGDQVELRAGGDAFAVSMTAIAEEDGAPGERIRVRADRKDAPIIAEVDGPGRVFLPGFK